MELVRIGKIVRAIGLDGLVGVAGSQGGLAELKRVALRSAGAAAEMVHIELARPQGRLWAVKLEGVSDRTAAEQKVGCEVLAAREDLGDPGEGLFFWGDLEGLAVETAAGESIGVVSGLLETGAVDVLVVAGRGGERLIPLAPYVTVDRAAGRIVVEPPEGLLDLGAPEKPAKGGPD